MIPLAKTATPAAKSVLRQATALRPKRKKASDGLLPSAAHVHQNPNSDHNSGFAVDLTHDPKHDINCVEMFIKLQDDKRVKYLIFKGRIWSQAKGVLKYTGSNPHNSHLHISIKEGYGNDESAWFPWLGKAKTVGKIVSKVKRLPKKKDTK